MEEESAMYIPSMSRGCGLISHVSDPMLVKGIYYDPNEIRVNVTKFAAMTIPTVTK